MGHETANIHQPMREPHPIRMSSIPISPSSICGLRTCLTMLPREESLNSTQFKATRPKNRLTARIFACQYHKLSRNVNTLGFSGRH